MFSERSVFLCVFFSETNCFWSSSSSGDEKVIFLFVLCYILELNLFNFKSHCDRRSYTERRLGAIRPQSLSSDPSTNAPLNNLIFLFASVWIVGISKNIDTSQSPVCVLIFPSKNIILCIMISSFLSPLDMGLPHSKETLAYVQFPSPW